MSNLSRRNFLGLTAKVGVVGAAIAIGLAPECEAPDYLPGTAARQNPLDSIRDPQSASARNRYFEENLQRLRQANRVGTLPKLKGA